MNHTLTTIAANPETSILVASNNTQETFTEEGSAGVFGTFMLAVTLICIIASSFVGNCLIFLIAYKKPSLLSIANRYILHLAICQFIMTIFVMPSTLISVFTKLWVFSDGWCVFTAFCKSLMLTSIILTLLLISVERYISISRPMTYHHSIVVKFWLFLLMAVWVVAILLAIPPIIGWSHIEYSKYQYACSVTPTGNGFGYILFLFFLGFLSPLLTMCFVYLKIFLEAKRLIHRLKQNPKKIDYGFDQTTSQETSATPDKEKNEKWVLSERRIAKTGMFIISAYAICWFPAFMVMIFYLDGQERPWWATASAWMAFASCSINPYVYVFRSRSMRKQVYLLLARMMRKDLLETDSETVTVQLSRGRSSLKKVESKKIYQKVPSIARKSGTENSSDVTVSPTSRTMEDEPV